MRKLTFILAALCLFLTGCMDFNMKLKIGEDGSSTLSMKLQMLDQMYQLFEAQMAQQGGADLSMFDRASLENMAKQTNGEVLNFQNESVDGKRIIDIGVRFKDGVKNMSNMAQGQMSIVNNGDGTMTVKFLDDTMSNQFRAMDLDQFAMQIEGMKPMMAGLRWQIDFEVPELTDTNLPRAGNTASFVLDFDNDWADKPAKDLAQAFIQMVEPKWITFKEINK